MTAPTTSTLTTITIVMSTPAGDLTSVEVMAEPTASPHLFLTPTVDGLGRLLGGVRLTHAPTGLALVTRTAESCREIAEKLAHLDWSFTEKDDFAGIKAEAAAVVRASAFTEPDAVELPAHDAWGKDGQGKGLTRAAIPTALEMLADFQRCHELMHGSDRLPLDVPDPDSPRGVKANPEWTAQVIRYVHDFGLAYLLLALHRVDPEVGDSAAAFLADMWESGDSLGEWAWEWHQALLKGERPTLPGIPDMSDFATVPDPI